MFLLTDHLSPIKTNLLKKLQLISRVNPLYIIKMKVKEIDLKIREIEIKTETKISIKMTIDIK